MTSSAPAGALARSRLSGETQKAAPLLHMRTRLSTGSSTFSVHMVDIFGQVVIPQPARTRYRASMAMRPAGFMMRY
jgi:hypothetical protein